MPQKKLLIFGGTGASGVHTVNHALSEGHEVIVYARNPDKLPEETRSNPKLKIFKGELSDSASLSTAFAERPDAIISILGPTTDTFFKPWQIQNTFTDAYKIIIREMRAHQVKRILVMGTVSIYDPKDKASFLRALLVWIVYILAHQAYKQIIAIDDLFKKEAGDLDWTIFRIGNLGDGPVGEIAAGYVGDGNTTQGIQRSELAKWLVEQAGKENAEWVKELPNVTTAAKRKV